MVSPYDDCTGSVTRGNLVQVFVPAYDGYLRWFCVLFMKERVWEYTSN